MQPTSAHKAMRWEVRQSAWAMLWGGDHPQVAQGQRALPQAPAQQGAQGERGLPLGAVGLQQTPLLQGAQVQVPPAGQGVGPPGARGEPLHQLTLGHHQLRAA